MIGGMTDAQADATANGQAPKEEPCEDCATNGEKLLAGVAFLFGLFVVAMAIDMFTGGAISRLVPVREVTGGQG